MLNLPYIFPTNLITADVLRLIVYENTVSFGCTRFFLEKRVIYHEMKKSLVKAKKQPYLRNICYTIKNMAIIEMIPPEYWRQMWKELNSIDWKSLDQEEEEKRLKVEQQEKERRAKAYDRAIKKKRSLTEEQKKRKRERDQRNYRKRHSEVKRVRL